jgi:RNA-directed DNA polymerase
MKRVNDKWTRKELQIMTEVKPESLMDLATMDRSEAQDRDSQVANTVIAEQRAQSPKFPEKLMEEIVSAENVRQALKRVESNAGSAGVDGMKTSELRDYLKRNWIIIQDSLLDGNYQPKPIKRVEIPKPGSLEKRKLGIPTVLDRFIQQSIQQVLQRKWDGYFSDHSFGFRPRRSAHQAVAKAQTYIREGHGYVVDIDLAQFFDRVNHDKLMGSLAKSIVDKRVLKLIRAYLNCGVMEQGLLKPIEEGTPQGGPLSPLLSNIVLDDLDRELEQRGHRFVRYADDCNIYVKSARSGERVMESVTRFIEKKLKLKVNAAKSAVARPSERKFLGFSFQASIKNPKIRIAPKAIARFKEVIRDITNRNVGRSLAQVVERLGSYMPGWLSYFKISQTPSVLRALDSWLRRRLRSLLWTQWKRPSGRWRGLSRLGIKGEDLNAAKSSKGSWRMSMHPVVKRALSDNYFDKLGVPRLAK